MDELDPVGVALQEEPRRRRPLLLATAVVAILVLTAWSAVWWGRTPEPLTGGHAARLERSPDRGPFVVSVTTPATRPGEGNVALVRVRPVVGRNDADADVSFVICGLKGESPLDIVKGSPDDLCSRTRPAEDTTLRVAGEYLLMVLTPREKGVVRVDAVEITYRNGWQLLWLPRTVTKPVTARLRVT